MNDFTYENQGTNTYLVYKVEDTSDIDEMSLGMLTNNHIPGLCNMLYNQLDTTGFLKYNVSAKLPVAQALAGVVNRNRFVGVLRGIADSMLAVDDYMLDATCILFDLDNMFMEVATGETELVYLPLNKVDFEQPDLLQYLKSTMFSLQFDQSENTEYVGRVLSYLNSATVFNPQEFKQVLDEIEGKGAAPAAKAAAPVKPAVAPTPVATPAPQPAAPAPTPATQYTQNSAPVSQFTMNQQVTHPSKRLTPNPAPAPAPQPAAPAPKVEAPKAPAKQAAPVNVGFSIPGGSSAPVTQQAPAANAAVDGDKEISLFYLLNHYNKDNAAKYKAQKAAKKAKKNGPVQPVMPAAPQGAPQGAPQVPPMMPQQPQQAAPQAAAPAPQQAVAQPVMPAAPVQQPQAGKLDFGNTTVLNASAGQGTTVLTPDMNTTQAPNQPYMVRNKNQERININKPQFKLGTEPTYADYCIRDNSAVSHSHAYIMVKDGECYIVDTNSTNHTYVNGSLIPSNQQVMLSDMDEITLANEVFTYHK